jgi:hypothetical protein
MSLALNINVFTAPEKTMVAERVQPFGPPPAFDPSTSTLIGTALFASSQKHTRYVNMLTDSEMAP